MCVRGSECARESLSLNSDYRVRVSGKVLFLIEINMKTAGDWATGVGVVADDGRGNTDTKQSPHRHHRFRHTRINEKMTFLIAVVNEQIATQWARSWWCRLTVGDGSGEGWSMDQDGSL